MRIIVYDVAANASGALGVLEEYYAKAVSDRSNEYLFLVSTPLLEALDHVSILRYPWIKKSWLHRLWFDLAVGPRIVREWGPDLIISLQNMQMPLSPVPQVVYEHNCIPRVFCDYRFSFFKDPILWIRQNILGAVIERSLKKADGVIVQSQWMKRRCVESLHIDPRRITVEPPKLDSITPKRFLGSEPFLFVYPATGLPFKNHELVLKAIKLINKDMRDYRVLFTLDGTENKRVARMQKKAEASGLPVDFIGWQNKSEVLDFYERAALLFVSELESCPLPLIEASRVGCPIIAPAMEYAMEALSGVDAFFYRQGDAGSLASAMMQLIQRYVPDRQTPPDSSDSSDCSAD